MTPAHSAKATRSAAIRRRKRSSIACQSTISTRYGRSHLLERLAQHRGLVRCQTPPGIDREIEIGVAPRPPGRARPEDPDFAPMRQVFGQQVEHDPPMLRRHIDPNRHSGRFRNSAQRYSTSSRNDGILGNNGGSRLGVVCVRRSRANIAEMPPRRPLSAKQALRIAGADQLREGHPCDLLRGWRAFLQIAPQRFMAQLVGEFEALDQPVAQLLVLRLGSVARKRFPQPGGRVGERGEVQRHGSIRLR